MSFASRSSVTGLHDDICWAQSSHPVKAVLLTITQRISARTRLAAFYLLRSDLRSNHWLLPSTAMHSAQCSHHLPIFPLYQFQKYEHEYWKLGSSPKSPIGQLDMHLPASLPVRMSDSWDANACLPGPAGSFALPSSTSTYFEGVA